VAPQPAREPSCFSSSRIDRGVDLDDALLAAVVCAWAGATKPSAKLI
jgi:hypothetical protein